MWRRAGDAGYAVLVGAVFTVEAVGLAALTWAFLLRRTGHGPSTFGLHTALVAAVAVTAIALMVLTVYALVYQFVTTRRDRRYAIEALAWSNRWIDVLFGGHAPPPRQLPAVAVDTLLDLRESVRGEVADKVELLLLAYGIDAQLIGRVVRNVPRKLRALDDLARARVPQAVPILMQTARDDDPTVRLMALRALARSASSIHSATDRASAAIEIVDLLHSSDVPGAAIDEALQLLDRAAPVAIAMILDDCGRLGPRMVCPALNAIGRLGLAEFASVVVGFAEHRRISIRAAAIRALGDLGPIPDDAVRAIRRGAHDRNEAVRVEVGRAARLLRPDAAVATLEPLLADRSWSVRRVAATSLSAIGPDGMRAVRRIALEHPDPRARSVATQVLIESPSVGLEEVV